VNVRNARRHWIAGMCAAQQAAHALPSLATVDHTALQHTRGMGGTVYTSATQSRIATNNIGQHLLGQQHHAGEKSQQHITTVPHCHQHQTCVRAACCVKDHAAKDEAPRHTPLHRSLPSAWSGQCINSGSRALLEKMTRKVQRRDREQCSFNHRDDMQTMQKNPTQTV
jgi:hypothetical protein